MVKGCTEKGMVTFMKHYALNDQETDRDITGVATWADEQTMRQVYLKVFEMGVKDGGSLGMMTSFNRRCWSPCSAALPQIISASI